MQSFRPNTIQSLLFFLLAAILPLKGWSANYIVTNKNDLITRMTQAFPGDTVFVANGTYNWGQINFTNTNSNSNSAWIVLKAQSFSNVVFTGNTYIQFSGKRIQIDGFKFANGNAGTNAVISFRSSSSMLADYCRVSNIIIDNYNTTSADTSVENEWIGIFGIRNRVDHCTFINKFNPRATVVVWYAATNYPAPAPSTYHLIDSNYFNGRSYMGINGGETIRVGTSTSSRTDGFNIIEYNLFENCTQTEPEIVSNKSDFNTYRYNTFKNCEGGLTLRHGRYCNVYGNFFIVDNPAVKEAYGIRVIDKGHKIFNNYIEGVNGNSSGGTTQLRAPINLYNGASADTTDAAAASGYFAADSCIVAFNTIVNAKGGSGIVLGGTGGGSIQPKGIIVSNNLVKMSSGSAVYLNSSNTALTFSGVGNIYNAPSGLGITASGWTNATLNFGTRNLGTLTPPANVADAAVNTIEYAQLIQSIDAKGRNRSAIFDVGAEELNISGTAIAFPLDSNRVGAGKPFNQLLPLNLQYFDAVKTGNSVKLNWTAFEDDDVLYYEIQNAADGNTFHTVGLVNAVQKTYYEFVCTNPFSGNNYFRLKVLDKDGNISYSKVRLINFSKTEHTVIVYPNPAKDRLYVSVANLTQTASVQLLLYSATGKLMAQSYHKESDGSLIMPLNSINNGIYFLEVINQNTTISQHKIFVLR